MLIDDELFDQKLYARIIKRSGLAEDIISFTMAKDAVAYLKDDTSPLVNLILLDIRMPQMNGFEFVEAAQNYLGSTYDTPIVMMLTTSLSPDDRSRAEASPAIKGFLNKPLKPGDLTGFIQILQPSKTLKSVSQA